ncbi:MAG: cobalamin-dependent protein [Candidatus Brocadiales bacterium]|nr:cobalamin-dependent protein [Candidatus Brocadiales bacterium]
MGILAGFLREKGLSVKILDREIVELNTDTLADCLKQCKKPHIVGISVMTANVANGYQIAEKVKSIDKEAKVIFGGIHATVMPEEILRQGNVDFAISGEGEYALLELIRQIKDKSFEPDRLEAVWSLDAGGDSCTEDPLLLTAGQELPQVLYEGAWLLFDYSTGEGLKQGYGPSYQGLLMLMRGWRYETADEVSRTLEGVTYLM